MTKTPSIQNSSTFRSTRAKGDAPSSFPPPPGFHTIRPADNFSAGDGYILPYPQLGSQSGGSFKNMPPPYMGPATGSSRSGARGSGSYNDRPRHFDTDDTDYSDENDSWDDDHDDRDRKGGMGFLRRHSFRRGSMSRGPSRRRSMDDARGRRNKYPWDRHDSASEDDSDSEDDTRSASRRHKLPKLAVQPRRSISKLQERAKELLVDSDNERTGNTELKKWGATMAGALAGGLAAHEVGKMKSGGRKRETWVPTALGAFMGGFATREAEKFLYKRKADAHEREENYKSNSNDKESGGRSRSQGW